ncbi:hypothetical protein ZWY2020_000104 [Hordeum vulgare]|nr:hypothetical protein ZWY2020_000104 [Hordeum vulgare]
MEMRPECVSVTGEEKHTCSCMVDVEKMVADENPDSGRLEAERWEAQSIYLVPEWLKGNNSKEYRPQLVSLGPFHHGDPNLMPMEEHKRRSLVQLIKRSKKPLQDFITAVDDVVEELQGAYGMDLDVKWRNDKRSFVDMMLTDGCFLLEIISNHFLDYKSHDPVFSKRAIDRIGSIIQSDMLLIENQLPLLLLKKILGVLLPPDYLQVEMDTKINLMVLEFLGREDEDLDMVNTRLRHHPLDLYHGCLTYKEGATEGPEEESTGNDYEPMPSALEIHEAGIKFRKSNSDTLLDVHFDMKRGVLTMPVMMLFDSTESLYLNLMAFERLHVGAGEVVTSYVICMDDMIVSARDVAMLRSNDVLVNMLGCDEEAAKLFNGTLSRGQLLGSCDDLRQVQYNVKAYCGKSWHKWRATLMRTHIRNPWAFISLVAATILLICTLLQTIYTMKQNKP